MSVLLFIIIIFLLGLLGFLSYQIKVLKDQLAYINKTERTNKRLSLSFHGFFLDHLVKEINIFIDRAKAKEEDLAYEQEKIKNQITSISHDLRTPLTSLVGYLDLLEKTKDPDQGLAYIEILKKKTSSLQKLVVDFYDISLLEDKNYQLDLEDLNPSYILEDLLMEYAKDLESRGISLDVEISKQGNIYSNSQALARVYGNLLSNIKNHGYQEAKIVHQLQDGSLQSIFSNRLNVDEKIDPNKLFEKFYTGQKSRNKGSSGIGMYASKVLLEKMGHQISASLESDFLTITIIY
ncbi:MAG: HAMP domain-containing sensor histidine kinase [Bacillota bacterium]|nr:HAMP domain-containing sensor histidine kinase [Bacillota bacterium]